MRLRFLLSATFLISSSAVAQSPESPVPAPSQIDVGQFVTAKPLPSFDNDVLVPLHQAQAQKAAREATEAARAEEEAQALQRQVAADIAATASRMAPAGTYDASQYAYHQCVWYVATRIQVPPNLGNAENWLYSLPANGFRQGAARVGAIGITQAGPFGHAVLAEQVSGDSVTISEYNGLVPFGYSERVVTNSEFTWFFR